MNRPLVTVVVPTRDRLALLARALESAVGQTETRLEIIVVDDGSREPVQPLIERLADDRIQLITHPRSGGAAAARNTAIRIARGEFIAPLDDDDVWDPNKIARQLECIQSLPDNVGFVYCGFRYVAQTGKVVEEFAPQPPAVTFKELLRSTFFGASIPLIRRQCFEQVGLFDETLPGTHDRDMWLRIARRYRLALVPDVLARCYLHGQQITTDLGSKIQAKKLMLEKYRVDLTRYPAIHAKHWTRLAMLYLAAGQPWRGRGCLLQSLRLQPGERNAYRQLMLALLPSPLHERLLTSREIRRVDGFNFYY